MSESTDVAVAAADTSSKSRRTPAKSRDGAASRAKRTDSRPNGSRETADLTSWLGGLEYPTVPKLHVNGSQYANCILTVDFGHPTRANKVNPDHVPDLIAHMRKVARAIMNKEVSIRISNDQHTGIWWACVG